MLVNNGDRASASLLYIPADFYLLRAPALPASTFQRLSPIRAREYSLLPDLDTWVQEQHTLTQQRLLEMSIQPQVELALAVASSSLYESLIRLRHGEKGSKHKQKVYTGLLRYLIRMSTRPTPFGLFAGVALGTFAYKTQTHLAVPALKCFRTRPDMHWLLTFLRKLEEDPTLVVHLNMRLNQTTYLVGERAMLPFADISGEQDDRAISLSATPVVRKVFELTRQYISYTDLQAALQHAFPGATTEQIQHLLWQLWEHHFLISQLHPPLTRAQPAAYVLEHLRTLPQKDERTEQLAHILEGTAALDHAGINAPVCMLSSVRYEQRQMVPESKDHQLLQVDAALHVKASTLYLSIGQIAARAAEFLLRQTAFPRGPHHLQEYRQLFLEKYGGQAEVPLLDLLSPEKGLDAPRGYTRPPCSFPRPSRLHPTETTDRDHFLLNLVTEAINSRSLEVELTEQIQRRLERWSSSLKEAPLSLEIYLHLSAHSREALDRGEWMAVVGRNCGSPNAGRTFGRFFDLLGEPALHRLSTLMAREEALLSDVLFAELTYQPSLARSANVAIRPPLRRYEIAIGVTPSVPLERVLALDDLVVGVHQGRLYLRSLRLGKRVRVCQDHMLNSQFAPNVCRFLSEIASDGQPVLSAFDWGSAAGAPFLPRLVIKAGRSAKLVITPARWQLHTETLLPKGEGSGEARWFRALQQWREQWRVPRHVYLSEGDNQPALGFRKPTHGQRAV